MAENFGLYDPRFEHDACGIGAVVDIKGRRSHATVDDALKIVENLDHRAGRDAFSKTGDGVGILLQISHKFFSAEAKRLGIELGGERQYAVGMFFFPQSELRRDQAKKMFRIVAEKEGLRFLGWRDVPVCGELLGGRARETMPVIAQCFIERPADAATDLDFDRRLYVTRMVFEQSSEDTYVASLSCRTIVYKGMFLVKQLRAFFPDLESPDYESAIALVHSRFSTNTIPSWQRAHPNRLIVHNGEINTIRGNVDKMLARQDAMQEGDLKGQMHKIMPVIDRNGSDSAMLDNALEFMMMSGMELPRAVAVMIPEPWANDKYMSRARRDFFRYYATMLEPWDGPASILFTDGDVMGAVLDRNGLRPSRYYIMDDGRLILASEVGVLELPQEHIVKKERLHPGRMLLVDTVSGEIIDDERLKAGYAARQPYGEWLDENLISLNELHIPNKRVATYEKEELTRLQKSFGYTYEDVMTQILPMARGSGDPTGSMGVDIPLPALTDVPQPLFSSFKQLFAQVTNPPIDAIREEVVTTTEVYLGAAGTPLEEKPENCRMLRVRNPILTSTDVMKLRFMHREGLKVETIPTLYYKNTSLSRAVEHLYLEADRAYREGATILILSDRGVDENHVAIPSLLAVSAVHQYLVKTRKRTSLSLVVESGEPREVHHFAALLGFGASAVNPYLAQETIRRLIDDGLLDKELSAAVDDYDEAVLGGVLKIASKMGISTLQSYLGAKVFESIGLSGEFVDEYFTGTSARLGGMGIRDVERQTDELHSSAFDPLGLATDMTLDSAGRHKSRGGKERHLYNPATISLLQRAAQTGDYELFRRYSAAVYDDGARQTLRQLFDFNYPETGIPLDSVEPVEEIVKRFKTGAMSYGSLSPEAHETLARAMNRLGGKSNCGEGGEDVERCRSRFTRDNRNSAIKQVASARFGVTSEYLVSAEEIQIKMAQGAKPGEGGHLPAGKVYPWVAKTRHSTPGVTLISPPPHHDIYSIEDLAQLIYDLKNANDKARITVKLVSEAGVGTIAAGVAKAGAGTILISGFDGGTGAAPLSSIHNAGLPWELGLAETQQTLMRNGLRRMVRIETDGKLMTGRDVLTAALLGAEEFGFATAPLVTLGCVMMRVCNLDTCPMGITTQNPELRRRFAGKPEYVENFMRFVAQELREYMARLGVATVDELVGRTDLLRVDSELAQARGLDFSQLVCRESGDGVRSDPANMYSFRLDETLDRRVLLKKLDPASKKRQNLDIEIRNTDRTFGTLLGSEITRANPEGLPEDTIHIRCSGSAGQSFGAFIPKGLTLELKGDANDYFGKGLSGGRLIAYPPKEFRGDADKNMIIGNVALYGATGGEAFVRGVAGERFCVRNSGASAVVEGVGDHGCEYMTGGCVVVLGDTGKNFAAGMSGGVAFVLDPRHDLYTRLNKDILSVEQVTAEEDAVLLRGLIERHGELTGSKLAQEIIADFAEYLPMFKKLIPNDYKSMRETIQRLQAGGMSREEAEFAAFYAVTGK